MTPWRLAGPCAASMVLLAGAAVRAADEPIPPNVQSAVDRGLAWLARNQQPSGEWSPNAANRTVASTGLAAMAFMSRGHVPGQGPYGERINQAVDFVLASQRGDDLLAAAGLDQPMYDHGICTVMLCEAYGMLDERRQDRTRTAIARAVKLILNAQGVRKSDPEDQGGWRYTPTQTNSDLSVTGWQLMALRAAGNIGAAVPRTALDAGIAYVKRRATVNGSFAYQDQRAANSALTGTGILSLILLNQSGSREVAAGADYLVRAPLGSNDSTYFYMVYYVSQAAWQLGGHDWDAINPVIRNSLLTRQKADGFWSPNGLEEKGGDAYATSMAILALTAPFRYLPIYQR